jgi:hypothetical protein
MLSHLPTLRGWPKRNLKSSDASDPNNGSPIASNPQESRVNKAGESLLLDGKHGTQHEGEHLICCWLLDAFCTSQLERSLPANQAYLCLRGYGGGALIDRNNNTPSSSSSSSGLRHHASSWRVGWLYLCTPSRTTMLNL